MWSQIRQLRKGFQQFCRNSKSKPITWIPQLSNMSKICTAGTLLGTGAVVAMSGNMVAMDEDLIDYQYADEDPQFDHFLKDFEKHRQKNGKPKKVLVIDGGGLRGCMPLQILKELENEIQKIDSNLHVWKVFDLIVGTSTGGLIAIGLSKEQMLCNEIDEFYDKVATRVFNKDISWMTKQYNKIFTVGSAFGVTTSLDTNELETVFKEFVGKDTNFPRNRNKRSLNPKDPNYEPNCVVISTLTNNIDLTSPLLIRNYGFPDIDNKDGYIEFSKEYKYYLSGISQCKTWEAARATSAAPTYFSDMMIDMPNELRQVTIHRNLRQLTGIGYDNENKDFVRIKNKQYSNILDNTVLNIDKLVKKYNNYEAPSNWNMFSSDVRQNEIKTIVDQLNNNLNLKINTSDFTHKIMDFDYVLRCNDGGTNSNAPLLFAYVESLRLWPNSDCVMFSLGTGRAWDKDVFENKQSSIFLANTFNTVFNAKEISTLTPMISFAYIDSLHLQRMNPQIDPSKDSMADASLMPYWRQKGAHFAQKRQNELEEWAKFLVKQYYS